MPKRGNDICGNKRGWCGDLIFDILSVQSLKTYGKWKRQKLVAFAKRLSTTSGNTHVFNRTGRNPLEEIRK